jgi:hypothetical protein
MGATSKLAHLDTSDFSTLSVFLSLPQADMKTKQLADAERVEG